MVNNVNSLSENMLRYVYNIICRFRLIPYIILLIMGTLFSGCSEQVSEIKNRSKKISTSLASNANSLVDTASDYVKEASNFTKQAIKNSNNQDDFSQVSSDVEAILEEIPVNSNAANNYAVNLSKGIWGSVSDAVKNNEGFQAAILLEDEAMSMIGVAKSVKQIQYSGQSTIGGIFESGNDSDDDTKGIAASFNISKLLYDGGQSQSSINQASARALIFQSERKVLGNKIALEAALSWVEIWYSQERLGLLSLGSEKLDSLINKMDRMAVSGMIDSSILEASKAQLVDISLQRKMLEADLAASEIRFKRYFSKKGINLEKPSFLLPIEKVKIEVNEWKKAPSLEASVATFLVARNEVLGAEAAFKPRAIARAGVNSPMKNGDTTDKSLGVLIEYTFGDGGKRRSKLKASQAKLESAKAKVKDTQLMLQTELNSTLARLSAVDYSIPLLRNKLKLTKANVKTLRSQLNTGQSTLEKLIAAEIKLFNTDNNLMRKEAELHGLILKISSLTGALGRNLNF
jgi:outer membrane protein, adhesin transport system